MVLSKKRPLSIDTEPYKEKSIIYIIEYKPVDEYESDKENRENESDDNNYNDIKYYNFGVTSNIDNRLSNHENDKLFQKVRLDKCFVYNTRNSASKGEKRIKRLLSDLDLRIKYFNKIECFKCNRNDLSLVYDEMEKHVENQNEINDKLNIEPENSVNKMEDYQKDEEKYKIEILKCKERIIKEKLRLFETGKLSFDQLERLLKIDIM